VDALERHTIDTVAKFHGICHIAVMIVVLTLDPAIVQKIYLHGNYHVADDRLFWTCLLFALASD
jgi:hypothetical protein